MICREDDRHLKGHPISPIALPSSPDANEFHPSSELQLGGNFKQVRHNAITEPSQHGRPGMVAIPNISNGSTSVPTRPIDNSALRCIQPRLGAVLNGQSHTGGVWSPEEATHYINYLELLGAFLAIKAFGKTWYNITVLLQLDNITAMSYINQKGGTVSKALCQLVITIWFWCTE